MFFLCNIRNCKLAFFKAAMTVTVYCTVSFQRRFLSKEHRDFYEEEKVVLRETELGRYPEVTRQTAWEEEPALKSLGLYSKRRRKKRKKKDKDKNKCLMSSKRRASVKQSVHRTV